MNFSSSSEDDNSTDESRKVMMTGSEQVIDADAARSVGRAGKESGYGNNDTDNESVQM